MSIPHFARFWMIARKPTGPSSRTEPKMRYSHRADAVADAKRLANETNAQFVLLEAVEIIRPGTDDETGSLL